MIKDHPVMVAHLVMADHLTVALACLQRLEVEVQQISISKIVITRHLLTEVEDIISNSNISLVMLLPQDPHLENMTLIPLHPASLVVHLLINHLRSQVQVLQEVAVDMHLLTCLLPLVAAQVSQELSQTTVGIMVEILSHTTVVVRHLRWASRARNSLAALLLAVLPVDTHPVMVLRHPLSSQMRTLDIRDNTTMVIMEVVIDGAVWDLKPSLKNDEC